MNKQYEEPRYSTWDDPNMDYSQPDDSDFTVEKEPVDDWGDPIPNDSEHEPCRSEIEQNWEQIKAHPDDCQCRNCINKDQNKLASELAIEVAYRMAKALREIKRNCLIWSNANDVNMAIANETLEDWYDVEVQLPEAKQ